MDQYGTLPTGQRVAPPTKPAPAPAPIPQQLGLGQLSQLLQAQKMGGPLPSKELPQMMMQAPQAPPSLDPLTEQLLLRQFGG